MMAPLLKAMIPRRFLERVKTPFRSISSYGSSIRREKERGRDIALVDIDERGGGFGRAEDEGGEGREGGMMSGDKGSVRAESYEV